MLKTCGLDTLANDPKVCKVLGTVKTVKSSNLGAFYSEVQNYLGSKKKRQESREVQTMAFWPLIKAVRIYVKAPILSTGVVLVDLVGRQ